MKDGLYTFRAEGCGHHLGNTLAHASGHARQEMLNLARISQAGQDVELSRILNNIGIIELATIINIASLFKHRLVPGTDGA